VHVDLQKQSIGLKTEEVRGELLNRSSDLLPHEKLGVNSPLEFFPFDVLQYGGELLHRNDHTRRTGDGYPLSSTITK
jgi:hypothetical protein